MDKQTLKALKVSIKKWERIVAGVEADYGSVNCSLKKMRMKKFMVTALWLLCVASLTSSFLWATFNISWWATIIILSPIMGWHLRG